MEKISYFFYQLARYVAKVKGLVVLLTFLALAACVYGLIFGTKPLESMAIENNDLTIWVVVFLWGLLLQLLVAVFSQMPQHQNGKSWWQRFKISIKKKVKALFSLLFVFMVVFTCWLSIRMLSV